MKKLLLFFVGLALVPVCATVTAVVVDLLYVARTYTGAIPPAAWCLLGGFATWLVVYFTLPRPMLGYILAHELTHALWALASGVPVFGMKVGDAQGHVTVARSNVWITLAPYFFPLYTVLVIAAYAVLGMFLEVERWSLLWLALVGASWGFHLTFTISALMQHQSDIEPYGRLFSYSLIYLLNVSGICLWILAVTPATLEQMVGAGTLRVEQTAGHARRLVFRAWEMAQSATINPASESLNEQQ